MFLILLLFCTVFDRIVRQKCYKNNDNGNLVFSKVINAAVNVDKIARLQNTLHSIKDNNTYIIIQVSINSRVLWHMYSASKVWKYNVIKDFPVYILCNSGLYIQKTTSSTADPLCAIQIPTCPKFRPSATDSKSHRKCSLYVLWSKQALPPADPPLALLTRLWLSWMFNAESSEKTDGGERRQAAGVMVPWADS